MKLNLQRIKTKNTKKSGYYSFILPGTLLIALMVFYPLFFTLYTSFSSEGSEINFTFENYYKVITAGNFLTLFKNTIRWVISCVSAAFILGFGTAILIEQEFIKQKEILRSVLLLPWILSGVVRAYAWRWLLSTDFGMLNHMLIELNIMKDPLSWLLNTDLAFISVVIVQVWGMFPYVMLITSAGMQSINSEYREVSLIEGASYLRYIYSIVIPLIKDVIFIALLLTTIWSINTFLPIWIVTQGGPAGSTTVLALDVYNKFLMYDLNKASATSIIQLSISMIFVVLYLNNTRKEKTY